MGWRMVAVMMPLMMLGAGCEGCRSYFEPENNLEVYQGAAPAEVDFPSYCTGVHVWGSGGEPFEEVEVDLQLFDVDEQGPQHRRGLFSAKVYYGEGDDEYFVLPVYFDSEREKHYFISPMHPESAQGGPLTLRFTDGEAECPGEVAWEVEALPPAPGALRESLIASSELAETLLESYGLELREVLEGPLDEVPVMALPLAMQAWATAHPDNPDSLLAQLDEGRLPVEVSAEDLALVDAIIGKVDAAGLSREALVGLAELEAEGPVELRFTPGPSEEGLEFGDDLGQHRQGICARISDRVEVEIANAEELSYYMRKAATVAGVKREVAKVGTLASVISVVPGPSAGVGVVLGLYVGAAQLGSYMYTNSMPRWLYDGEVRSYTSAFIEDYRVPGQWDDFVVSAHAPGWVLGGSVAKMFVNLALAAAWGVDNLTGAGRIAKKTAASTLLRNEMKIGNDDVATVFENIVEFFVANAAGTSLEGMFDLTLGCEIRPGPWTDISLYVDTHQVDFEYQGGIGSRANGADVAAGFCSEGPLNTNKRVYEPRHAGGGAVVVWANGTRAAFPPQSNQESSRWEGPVTITPIRVEMEQRVIAALPGDSVILNAEIFGEDARGQWEVTYGEATLRDISEDGGRHTVVVELPATREEFPVEVTLTSLSFGGLRSPSCGQPPRQASVLMRNEESLRISPRARCIQPDEPLQLSAEAVTLAGDARVTWEASGGSISSDGRFVSADTGEYTISASIEERELYDSVRVRVGHCECFYDMETQGVASGSVGDFKGISALYVAPLLTLDFGSSHTARHTIVAELPVGEQPLVVPANFSVALNEIFPLPFPHTSAHGEGMLTITRWTENGYIEGVYQGTAPGGTYQVNGQQEVYLAPTSMELRFMAPVRDPEHPLAGLFVECPLL
ncbi:hypothetical protein [Lujinxingia litoralis]|uniref:hypothetical protein n=1 Tax=Lujinxingia litoralis TaxID=2211119 RepID=UPI0011B9420B|nr:hypothetical protein [Lujinxingia litoralis]